MGKKGSKNWVEPKPDTQSEAHVVALSPAPPIHRKLGEGIRASRPGQVIGVGCAHPEPEL